jgi:hypothetical protein
MKKRPSKVVTLAFYIMKFVTPNLYIVKVKMGKKKFHSKHIAKFICTHNLLIK